ncbi:hypothetical protein F2Q69_00021952 [Brassica cretica]|uniref:Uncharacterized protein n=1 Tax=Brassica cretica TaxID=69181 RepID=A0A8S9QEY1_BRACR|nr:hypothetical protein F2Q69_00021952 [Brassica cretica]
MEVLPSSGGSDGWETLLSSFPVSGLSDIDYTLTNFDPSTCPKLEAAVSFSHRVKSSIRLVSSSHTEKRRIVSSGLKTLATDVAAASPRRSIHTTKSFVVEVEEENEILDSEVGKRSWNLQELSSGFAQLLNLADTRKKGGTSIEDLAE